MLLKVQLGKIFFDMTESTSHKSKNKYVGLHQTKKLLHRKETINKIKTKRQTKKWKIISTNHLSDKGLIFKVYRKLR